MIGFFCILYDIIHTITTYLNLISYHSHHQCTIVVMFGPAKALKGSEAESVKHAADDMRHQMYVILRIAFISITSLFLGAMLYCWDHLGWKLALPTSCVYCAGYAYFLMYGYYTFTLFRLDDDITKDKIIQSNKGNLLISHGEVTYDGDGSLVDKNEVSKLKYKGELWKRKPLEKGGTFHKAFVVIEYHKASEGYKGKADLDIYESKESYATHQNPMNAKPFKLYHYILETDPRKFEREVTSIRNYARKKLLGATDFKANDLLSDRSLKESAENFKFALLPKVQTELLSQETLEFIAPNKEEYEEWLQWLRVLLNAFDADGKPTVEQTVRKGMTDLYTAVRTANV